MCLCLAQALANNNPEKDLPFAPGEQLSFDIHFHWGIIMAKAGSAFYSVSSEDVLDLKSAYCSTLSFRTSAAFDKIFKMRDTLYSYVNAHIEPVYHKKYLHEGNTNYVEELAFVQFGEKKTEARSIRYNADGNVRFEKTLKASTVAFDMLNIFMFTRMLDFDNLTVGETIPLSAFIGRDNIKLQIKYAGQVILEKNDSQKYKALKFEVDVIDDAFTTSKKALEIWIGDDSNRYPLRIRAKLKIGTVEANLSSFSGNKYPHSSLIQIKPHN
jgi:hypothetical protein